MDKYNKCHLQQVVVNEINLYKLGQDRQDRQCGHYFCKVHFITRESHVEIENEMESLEKRCFYINFKIVRYLLFAHIST